MVLLAKRILALKGFSCRRFCCCSDQDNGSGFACLLQVTCMCDLHGYLISFGLIPHLATFKDTLKTCSMEDAKETDLCKLCEHDTLG